MKTLEAGYIQVGISTLAVDLAQRSSRLTCDNDPRTNFVPASRLVCDRAFVRLMTAPPGLL